MSRKTSIYIFLSTNLKKSRKQFTTEEHRISQIILFSVFSVKISGKNKNIYRFGLLG